MKKRKFFKYHVEEGETYSTWAADNGKDERRGKGMHHIFKEERGRVRSLEGKILQTAQMADKTEKGGQKTSGKRSYKIRSNHELGGDRSPS